MRSGARSPKDIGRRGWVAAAATATAVALPCVLPTPAAAGGCGHTMSGNGLGIVEIHVANVTCATGRTVARRATAGGDVRRRVTAVGRTWRCRVLQRATGTDPGYIARTKVRCVAGRAVVRFQLAS